MKIFNIYYIVILVISMNKVKVLFCLFLLRFRWSLDQILHNLEYSCRYVFLYLLFP